MEQRMSSIYGCRWKWAMVESAREMCDSVGEEGKNPKSVWWNDEVKASVTGGCLEGCVSSYQ